MLVKNTELTVNRDDPFINDKLLEERPFRI